MVRICIVDTTFARVDMARRAIAVLKQLMPDAQIFRRTVPGLKDVPVEVLRMFEEYECDAGMVFGWVGPTLTDKITYAAYSIAMQLVQLKLGKHVIDVTVHEDEAGDEESLLSIAIDRAEKHAYNLYLLLRNPEELSRLAGTGRRQGYPDVGSLE